MRNAECGMVGGAASLNSSFIIPRSSFLEVVGQVVPRLVLDEEAVALAQGFDGLRRDARYQQVLAFEFAGHDRADADDAAGWYHASRRDANLRADVGQLPNLYRARA